MEIEIEAGEQSTGYPEFSAPEGFAPEEGVEEDQEFEAIATLKRKPDGKLCLVALDGARFPDKRDGYEEEAEEVSEEVEDRGMNSERSFSDRLSDASKRMMG